MRRPTAVGCVVLAFSLAIRAGGEADIVSQGVNPDACCDGLIVSPDGHLLAAAGGLGMTLWDIDHELKLRFIKFRDSKLTVAGADPSLAVPSYRPLGVPAFSPDGKPF